MLRPDLPSSLGNPLPPFTAIRDLPDAPPARTGRVVALAPGSADVDLARSGKILVPKLDFIGDWVLATPFLAGLRRAAPDAEITAIVLDRVFDLAAPCRLVDRVVAVPVAAAGPVRFGAATAAGLGAFLADYDGGAFDLALVPRWDTDFNGATRLAGLSGAATVIGFAEACTTRKAIDNRGYDRFLDVAVLDTRQRHEVGHMLGFLAALGGGEGGRLQIDLTDADRAAAAEFRTSHLAGLDRPLLVVAPFAAGRRQWPPERMARLASFVARECRMDVAVIGGPENVADAGAMVARIGGAGVKAASTAGMLGLRQNAALMETAVLFLGMDSGPAHMAAALGVPVVIASCHPVGAPPTHPNAPERFGPWVEPDRVLLLRPPVHRAPCTVGCNADDPHCILELTMEDVAPRVLAFAEAQASGVQR